MGPPTEELKLKAPVKVAKTVASMYLGVTFVNSTTVGR
jgi:hypothetical protein